MSFSQRDKLDFHIDLSKPSFSVILTTMKETINHWRFYRTCRKSSNMEPTDHHQQSKSFGWGCNSKVTETDTVGVQTGNPPFTGRIPDTWGPAAVPNQDKSSSHTPNLLIHAFLKHKFIQNIFACWAMADPHTTVWRSLQQNLHLQI